MQKHRILIVDDEEDLREILKYNLEEEGFDIDAAMSSEQALELDLTKYDLFILDVMMDGISGFELLKILRLHLHIHAPAIFLTALTSEDKILEGFKIGADDYVHKPFSPKEMVARVNAVLERSTLSKHQNELMYNGIKVEAMKKRVLLDNTPIDFTRTEYDIFLLLFNEPGKVYSRDEILKIIWSDEHYVLGRTVDVNITRIRKKLGDYGECIVTRSGYGYYFDKRKVEQVKTRMEAV